MPPESLPWDRRDFRKHERSGSDSRLGGGGFGGGGPQRWREQNHHPHAPPPHSTLYHHHQQRWYSDFRSSRSIPPGHGKQGGWHMYTDESDHGFMPFGSRYSDRNLEDENCRPFGSRGDGRYLRNNRENGRGSFSQKDWKAPSWEPTPGRPTAEANQRSIDKTQTWRNNTISRSNDPPPPLLCSIDLVDQPQSLPKEQDDKSERTTDVMATAGQKLEKENGVGSIDWKPLKWPRSGSFSSRGSGFSHSSSSKSLGVESVHTVTEVQVKHLTPIQSPTEAAAGDMSAALSPLDETSSRKKARLGWGEGLAKYEKKKVEGPEDAAMKVEMAISPSNVETSQFHAVNLLEKSPGVASLSDCASPATPSSVACSSSPGIEEKESVKGANTDRDRTNFGCSPSIVSQNPYDGPILNLENLELSSIGNLSNSINELLRYDESCSFENGYVRNSLMNKLLVWKADILKALEVTETEIDSLETELKTLVAEPPSFYPFPASSDLLRGECGLKPDVGLAISSRRPARLQVVSSGHLVAEDKPATMEDGQMQLKDEDFDSPGSATSKYTEVLPTGEDDFHSEAVENIADSVNFNMKDNLDEKFLENGPSVEEKVNHELISTNSCQNHVIGSDMYYDCRRVYRLILASNKDSIDSVLEELNNLLPAIQRLTDLSAVSKGSSSLHTDSSLIAQRFLKRKQFLQFKEKVITLKFKVFQHFWKEGRVLSVRKLRLKSHKKFDLIRAIHKKNRSSSRSRMSASAGSSRTVSADEVVEHVNALLLDSAIKPCRVTLKMPALILDKKAMMMSSFISTNGLVDDPCSAEKERGLINPWTSEEREIFIDKLAAFGKDFKKISSFLDHKTIADCVEFYYKNHKSECFERARKKPEFTKRSKSTAYLVTSGQRWNREANAASLDILGAASAIAANVDGGVEDQQKCDAGFIFGASSSYRAPRPDDCPLLRSKSLDMCSNERETIAADVLAGICGSLSSEAMSSCITSSVDPGDGHQDWRCQRVGSSTKQVLTPEVSIDDECSDESCGEMDATDWTDEEKSVFIQAFSSYGKDFGMISQCVGTKSRDQCKVFFSKARKCLGLDGIQPVVGIAGSGDADGGGSDSEDACIIKPGSVICNEVCNSKVEEDFRPSDVKLSNECDMSTTLSLKLDFNACEETKRRVPDDRAAEPAPKNTPTGDDQLDGKPVNVDHRDRDIAVAGCSSVQDIGCMAVSSYSDSMFVKAESSLPSGSNENGALTGASSGEENDRPGLLADNLGKKVEDRGTNSSAASGTSCGVNAKKPDPMDAGNDSHPSADVDPGIEMQNLSESEKKPGFERCPSEKSNVATLQQKGPLASMEPSTLFSVPIKYQKTPPCDILSAATDDHRNIEKHTPKIVRNGDCQMHRSSYGSENVASSQILRGYPVAVHTMKEMNGDFNCKRPVSLQHAPVGDGILHSDRHVEFSLQKCNALRQQMKCVEVSFPFQEQSREPSTSQSSGSCDVDKSSGNGDVKLFGKILKSSQQKSNSPAQREDTNNGQLHELGAQPLNVKFSADQGSLDAARSKFDYNNYLPSETIPMRSFGFWDGNRMQTGIPPLPDSTLLLTKYPAAFSGNYAIPTVNSQQPPSRGVVVSGDRPLNSVSVFPTSKEMSSSNGLSDYQILRNVEFQQPLSMGVKQPHDVLFSEMQRRNGFDASGMQQQHAQGMVGINVLGRGVLVGGQCSGVSDPVAAIKMHYAKAEQFSLQAGNVIKEDDAWRSNGDVGR